MRLYYLLKRGLFSYLVHDLKSEYMMKEESHVLWAAIQTRYEQ
jgi:hypothetical protein